MTSDWVFIVSKMVKRKFKSNYLIRVSFAAAVVGKADGLAEDSHSLFLWLVT